MLSSHKLLLLKKAARFTDSFTRANGAIGGTWTGTNWTVSGNAVINTPALGAETVTNGTFAADVSWTKDPEWTIAAGVASLAPATAANITQASGAQNKFAQFSIDCVSLVSPQITLLVNGYFYDLVNATTTSGQQLMTGSAIGVQATGPGAQGSIDNFSIKVITPTAACATMDFLYKSGYVQVGVTRAGTDCLVGVVMNVDNAANVQNCVIAALTSNVSDQIQIYKVVGGVISLVGINGITYSAGAPVKLSKNGTSYRASYNGVQLTAYTIADAAIQTGTKHGMFSLGAQCTLDNFASALH